MELLKNDSISAIVKLTMDDLLILHQSMNEVCHSIELFEFNTRMGGSQVEVKTLINVIRSIVGKVDKYSTE